MDATEFRQLEPKLARFLREFDDCFARKDMDDIYGAFDKVIECFTD